MGKYGKWIGAGLGFTIGGGPIGAILGYLIGSAVDSTKVITRTDQQGRRMRATQGDFVVSLMVLVASVMKADGKVVRAELDYVKDYLKRSFGTQDSSEAVLMLRDMLKQEIPVDEVCLQIQQHVDYSSRLQLLHFLFGIAKADGLVSESELKMIERIALNLGINTSDYTSIKSMFYQDSVWAYKVLELDKSATDDEVKKAYRRMAIKYHPDKVSYLGEEVQNSAKEKFQKVNEAFENIKKERGIS